MTLQSQTQLWGVFTTRFAHLPHDLDPAHYRLVGTAAALLCRVQRLANDLDRLAKERATVDWFAATLQPHFRCLQPPTYFAADQQYLTSYEVARVVVEMRTRECSTEVDGFEGAGPGPWRHYQRLVCGSYTVPTVALERRLVTELARNRANRYKPLLAFLRRHGCDIGWVQQGLQAQGIAATVQTDIIKRLRRNKV